MNPGTERPGLPQPPSAASVSSTQVRPACVGRGGGPRSACSRPGCYRRADSPHGALDKCKVTLYIPCSDQELSARRAREVLPDRFEKGHSTCPRAALAASTDRTGACDSSWGH